MSHPATRAAIHMIGRDRHSAEKLLINWLGFSPAGAASVTAMFLGAETGKVQGPGRKIEEAIRDEMNREVERRR